MTIWNPWHGCQKYSEGCAHCYVYRRDEAVGRDPGIITKTGDFDLPLRKSRQHTWRLSSEGAGTVYACMTSDFFLPEADAWRADCWDMIRTRSDLQFVIITKRVARVAACLPPDWGTGWAHVTLTCTCENQARADERLPILLSLPLAHRAVICEPLLGPITLEAYLQGGQIELVSAGGESGPGARLCDNAWVLDLRRQCIRQGVSFQFHQTGALFRRDGRTYRIDRQYQQAQADRSGYSYTPGTGCADAIAYTLPDRQELFGRLSQSAFRQRFHLGAKERAYAQDKGMDCIRSHARDFIAQRLAPENPPRDGKQTPMRGHPVFIAQHATACCCRSCLEKWHHIPAGKVLSEREQAYIADVLLTWIAKQMPPDWSR